MAGKKTSFEDSLKKLEEASDRIKSEDASLEEAIKSYKDGLIAYKECRKILDDAVQEIETLTEQVES